MTVNRTVAAVVAVVVTTSFMRSEARAQFGDPTAPFRNTPFDPTTHPPFRSPFPNQNAGSGWTDAYMRAPGRVYRTACGASLRRITGNGGRGSKYVLQFDAGPRTIFIYRGTTGRPDSEQFVFVAEKGRQPAYNIWKVVTGSLNGRSWIAKHYLGRNAPVYHDGWNGRWMN